MMLQLGLGIDLVSEIESVHTVPSREHVSTAVRTGLSVTDHQRLNEHLSIQ